MAHAQPDLGLKLVHENIGLNNNNNNNKNNNIKKKRHQKKKDNGLSSRGGDAFKFNAQAQEFVPNSMPLAAVPVSGYFVKCLQSGGGDGGADQWVFVSDKDAKFVTPTSQSTKNNDVLTEQLQIKIIKQVEYQLSDMSLLANENLVKEIQNDAEGFVPLSLVSSTKKLKSIVTGNPNLIAEALHASTKLDVSSDGTRVKRKNPFTRKEKEELQGRTVVAENLPDDHSHQNLEKIFNVAGVVKTIRVCQPQEATSRAKRDCVVSTKLHALVEFENAESAEKAVEMLNDDKKWRKGLRVRLMIRRSPKSVLKGGKSVFDGYLDDDEEEDYQVDNNAEDTAAASKKVTTSRRREKTHQPRSPTFSSRASQSSPAVRNASSAKHTTKRPEMPDGTKGFNMGRGRQLTISV